VHRTRVQHETACPTRNPVIPNRAESAVRNLLLRRDGPRAGWNQESFPYRRLERFFGGSQLPPQRLWQTPRQRLPWNLRAKERCTRRSTGAAATARESPLPAASHFQSPLPRPPARAPAPSKIAGRLRLRNMDHPLRHAPIIFPSQNRRCHPESAKQRTPTIRSALADEGPMQLLVRNHTGPPCTLNPQRLQCTEANSKSNRTRLSEHKGVSHCLKNDVRGRRSDSRLASYPSYGSITSGYGHSSWFG
jgi:hypothetical protein